MKKAILFFVVSSNFTETADNFDPRVRLRKVSFLKGKPEELAAVVGEWSNYVALTCVLQATMTMTSAPSYFVWEENKVALPMIFAVARLLLLGQPSAATPERAFSVKKSFSDLQCNALANLVELIVMIKYNDSQHRELPLDMN